MISSQCPASSHSAHHLKERAPIQGPFFITTAATLARSTRAARAERVKSRLRHHLKERAPIQGGFFITTAAALAASVVYLGIPTMVVFAPQGAMAYACPQHYSGVAHDRRI